MVRSYSNGAKLSSSWLIAQRQTRSDCQHMSKVAGLALMVWLSPRINDNIRRLIWWLRSARKSRWACFRTSMQTCSPVWLSTPGTPSWCFDSLYLNGESPLSSCDSRPISPGIRVYACAQSLVGDWTYAWVDTLAGRHTVAVWLCLAWLAVVVVVYVIRCEKWVTSNSLRLSDSCLCAKDHTKMGGYSLCSEMGRSLGFLSNLGVWRKHANTEWWWWVVTSGQ